MNFFIYNNSRPAFAERLCNLNLARRQKQALPMTAALPTCAGKAATLYYILFAGGAPLLLHLHALAQRVIFSSALCDENTSQAQKPN